MSVWVIVAGVAMLVALVYMARLGFDLLILAGIVIAGIVKLVMSPFHRHHRP